MLFSFLNTKRITSSVTQTLALLLSSENTDSFEVVCGTFNKNTKIQFVSSCLPTTEHIKTLFHSFYLHPHSLQQEYGQQSPPVTISLWDSLPYLLIIVGRKKPSALFLSLGIPHGDSWTCYKNLLHFRAAPHNCHF